MLNIDLDMTVEEPSEVTMSVDDGDEITFGLGESIVIKDHNILDNRDLPDQHPISAITGLSEALAEGGKIATVKRNGTALPIVDKTVDISVPTKTSDLDDDLVYNLGEIEVDASTDMFSITQEQHDAIVDMIRRAGISKCYLSYTEGGESYALPILDYVSYMGMTFVVFGEYEPSINSIRMIGISTTMNIGGFMRFPLLSRDDVQTMIGADTNIVHIEGQEIITGNKTFANGVQISRPNSGAILKLSSSAGDTNFILERTGGSQCVLESGATVGLFGTKTNHPLQVRTNYINRMTVGTDGSVVLATDVAQNSNNNQVATTKWVNAKGYAQSSDIPTKTSDLTNDSGFITASDVPQEVFEVMLSPTLEQLQAVLENGYVSGVTTSKTAEEIFNAFKQGKLPICKLGLYGIDHPDDGVDWALQYRGGFAETNLSDQTVVYTVNFGSSGDLMRIPLFEYGMDVRIVTDSAYIEIRKEPYLTEITSYDVTNALGYSPVNPTALSSYMQKGVDYVTAGQKSGTTLGTNATAEGNSTTASNTASHAEGWITKATGLHAHAEGQATEASGEDSHAEGNSTKATKYYAHAEGLGTTASGSFSHAEGRYTTASNRSAHAEGEETQASGYMSHAEGYYTSAKRKSQHTFGEYNVAETGASDTRGTYVEIVGNGTADNARSNARTLDWSGNEWLAGKLTVGADPTSAMEVATKQYVDNSAPTALTTTEIDTICV